MNLSAGDMASRRMAAQLLQGNEGSAAEQAVTRLGGIQAQDYAGAEWSVGIRLPEASEEKVEMALADGEIVRTWAYRGTLHYLAADDIPWLLSLLAPLTIAANHPLHPDGSEKSGLTAAHRAHTAYNRDRAGTPSGR